LGGTDAKAPLLQTGRAIGKSTNLHSGESARRHRESCRRPAFFDLGLVLSSVACAGTGQNVRGGRLPGRTFLPDNHPESCVAGAGGWGTAKKRQFFHCGWGKGTVSVVRGESSGGRGGAGCFPGTAVGPKHGKPVQPTGLTGGWLGGETRGETFREGLSQGRWVCVIPDRGGPGGRS